MTLRRPATIVLAAVLVLGTVFPAAADTTDFRADAVGSGIDLSVLDTVDLSGAVTVATVEGTPRAAASGVGLSQLDGTHTEVDVTSGSARDPEGEGDACATPELPAPLTNIGIGLFCSAAAADADALAASARGAVGDIDLDGTVLSDLVSFLVGTVAGPLAEQIDALVEPLEDATGPLLAPVIEPLAEQCQAGLEELLGPLGDILEVTDDLAEMDPTGLLAALQGPIADAVGELGAALPQACADLLTLLVDLPSVESVLADLAAALTDALAGLDLLHVTLAGSDSDVARDGTAVVARSDAAGARVELPALGDLTGLVDALVAEVVGSLVGQVTDSLDPVFHDLVPTVEELLQPVLDAVQVPDLLNSTDPLLVLSVSPAAVVAALDTDSGEVTTSGEAAVATVQLTAALAALLGENTTITVPAGETATIAEGTPLESTIVVANTAPVSRETAAFTMTGTRADGVSLDLLTGINGGLSVSLSSVEAAVGGALAAAPPPVDEQSEPTPTPTPDSLPRTGGGLALLGMLALAGGAGLRSLRR